MRRITFWGGNYRSLKSNREDLMRELHLNGWKIHAIIPQETIHPEDVPDFLTLHMLQDDNKRLNPFLFMKTVRDALGICRSINSQVNFAYNFRSVLLCSLMKLFTKDFRIITLVTGLGSVFSQRTVQALFLRLMFKFMYCYALRVSDHVVFQNRDDFRDLRRLGNIKFGRYSVVGGSGVNLQTYAESTVPSQVCFCMVARPLQDKGLIEFLKAAYIVKCQRKDVKFSFVGEYPRNAKYHVDPALFDELTARAGVEVTGKLKDVRSQLRASSIFVLPSYYREGIPRAGLEAMSMGRPIIAADSPGTRELVIDHFNGFLVEPRSVDDLTEKMLYLCDNPDLQRSFGKNSRRLAQARFDVENVNLRLIEIIENG